MERILETNKIKVSEQDLEEDGYNNEYLDYRRKLSDRNVDGIKIRSKCK